MMIVDKLLHSFRHSRERGAEGGCPQTGWLKVWVFIVI
jgi:hypothetical protein